MHDSSRRTFLTYGGVLGIAALSGCAAPSIETQEEETRVIPPDSFDSLEVWNINGSVTVETWDEDDIELRIVKRAFFTEDFDAAEIDVAGDDTLVIARIVHDEEPGLVVVSLELRVPAEFPVTHASTSNGFVDIRGTTGDLEVRTTNGKVDVQDVDGFVRLSTSNGSVTAYDVGGVDGARTTNGSIDIHVPAIRVDTSIETSNGSIDAALAGELDAELEAQTSNGSIDTSSISLSESAVSRTRVTGILGAGGPMLTLLTSNGSIELSLLSE
ncbi:MULTISPECIES: DUF4097 family beta strand repeat-containing protein [Haloferax]|uniref:DUF4097 family beta strand repeat protein n=1 Tax=Haloferax marinum TaxID=2666143 RepID=A0A6A8G4P6_9EURY|nr:MULTISPECIES: DUF4097 family beta strand repeat-containing protein [Haloferax]KAB1196747.1 DUF4097 domain-containing protein [Haloferax sp. CBA1150]MRW95755.1 DUF4097 family beta strand repeat protein [Haloferax marinum]